jgi:hypothetical protein
MMSTVRDSGLHRGCEARLREREVRIQVRVYCARGIYTRNLLPGIWAVRVTIYRDGPYNVTVSVNRY